MEERANYTLQTNEQQSNQPIVLLKSDQINKEETNIVLTARYFNKKGMFGALSGLFSVSVTILGYYHIYIISIELDII